MQKVEAWKTEGVVGLDQKLTNIKRLFNSWKSNAGDSYPLQSYLEGSLQPYRVSFGQNELEPVSLAIIALLENFKKQVELEKK